MVHFVDGTFRSLRGLCVGQCRLVQTQEPEAVLLVNTVVVIAGGVYCLHLQPLVLLDRVRANEVVPRDDRDGLRWKRVHLLGLTGQGMLGQAKCVAQSQVETSLVQVLTASHE